MISNAQRRPSSSCASTSSRRRRSARSSSATTLPLTKLSPCRCRSGLKIAHVAVPWAMSLPVSSLVIRASAVAMVPPRWITSPVASTRPVSLLIGRTKFVLNSSVV